MPLKTLYILLILHILISGCDSTPEQRTAPGETDIEILTTMISFREQAMATNDVAAAMMHFADDATWINSQGYYFEGRDELENFHRMLAEDTSRKMLIIMRQERQESGLLTRRMPPWLTYSLENVLRHPF